MADDNPQSSYRFGLLALSTELLHMIFGCLGMVEWKRLRLVNGELKNIATRYCFREVKFELNKSSVKRLSDIAFHKELFLHVQHFVLRRTRGLREFSNFNEWKESIILPGKSFLDFDEEIDEDIGDDYSTDGSLMSLREWSDMLDSEKKALYREYEIDRKNELSEIRGTTNHFSFRRLGCSRYARVHPERIPETITPPSPIQRFDEAVARFTNLTRFQHRPSCYSDDGWATRWRRLRISGFALLEFTTCDEDDDVEALQLSYVLRALGWAKRFHQELRSMSFYVCGPSFWGPDRLQCLWEGNGHQEIRASQDMVHPYIRIRGMMQRSVFFKVNITLDSCS